MTNTGFYHKNYGEILDCAPDREPERQYYFLKQLKEIIDRKKKEEGYQATFHIET